MAQALVHRHGVHGAAGAGAQGAEVRAGWHGVRTEVQAQARRGTKRPSWSRAGWESAARWLKPRRASHPQPVELLTQHTPSLPLLPLPNTFTSKQPRTQQAQHAPLTRTAPPPTSSSASAGFGPGWVPRWCAAVRRAACPHTRPPLQQSCGSGRCRGCRRPPASTGQVGGVVRPLGRAEASRPTAQDFVQAVFLRCF